MTVRASNLLVLQGGGPSPVVNTTLYGVIDEARVHGAFVRILGARHGITGLMQDNLVDLSDIAPRQIEQLKYMPGASLGTTRHKPSDTEMQRIVENLRRRDIHHLLLIGGNGFVQCLLLHDDEGDTVSQAPSLVGTSIVQLDCAIEESRIHANNMNVRRVIALLNKLNSPSAIECAQRVANFNQDGFSHPNLGG